HHRSSYNCFTVTDPFTTICHTHALFIYLFFFFQSPTPPSISTLSLHDALPISPREPAGAAGPRARPRHGDPAPDRLRVHARGPADRKSTRLNSSHVAISYAVFCLKKKKIIEQECVHITTPTHHSECKAVCCSDD